MGKRGSGGGAQAGNARELKLFLKNRMWRDHWYVLVGAGAIVVALFASAFLQFSTARDHIYRIETSDPALLARVFRSGEPWVVLCARPDDVVPDVFGKVSKRLVDKSYVGVMDCSLPLPSSGKSVFTRYGIKSSVSPTVFTVANGDKPKQVFLNHLQSSKALAKQVVAQTKKSLQEVQSSTQLDARCLHKDACVLILRGQRFSAYEKQWLDRLMKTHRKVSFVWMDSTILKLSIESMLPKFARGDHRLVLFRRERDPETNKKTLLTARAYRNAVFDAMPVEIFVEDNLRADEQLKVLSSNPTISRRSPSKGRSRRPNRKQETGADDEGVQDEHSHHGVEEEVTVEAHEVEEEEEVLDLDDEPEE